MSEQGSPRRRSRSGAFSESPVVATPPVGRGRGSRGRSMLGTLEESEQTQAGPAFQPSSPPTALPQGRRRSGAVSFSTPLQTSTPIVGRDQTQAIGEDTIESPPPMRSRSSAFSGNISSQPRFSHSSGVGRGAAISSALSKSREESPPPMRSRSSAFSGSVSSRQRSGTGSGVGRGAAISRALSISREESPPPMRSRSSAITGGTFSRDRSGALMGTSGAEDPFDQSLPMARKRSSAISGPSEPSFSRQRSGALSSRVITPLSGAAARSPTRSPGRSPARSPTRSLTKSPDQSASAKKEEQPTYEPPILDPSLRDYFKQKEGIQHESFSAYEPHKFTTERGTPIPFGRVEDGTKKYPPPEMEQLAHGDAGYDFQHPSEEGLPVTSSGERAGYGVHKGGALHGPFKWAEYYREWVDIGDQYQVTSSLDEPMPQEEVEYCQSYGFNFLRKLGSGGQATVWLCRVDQDPLNEDRGPPNMLACKVCSLIHHKRNRTLEQAVNLLVKEAQMLEKLEHANIVNCEHVFHIHDPNTGFPHVRCLIFMELCDGDLKDMLESKPDKRMSEDEARVVMQDVSLALEYLHNQNVAHLDIKVHNIMHSDRSGRVTFKLGDFGISRRHQSAQQIFIGNRVGTPGYIAPELDNIGRPGFPSMVRSKPADIYSLGKVLAEMLGGRAKQTRFTKNLHENSTNGIPDQQVLTQWNGISEAAGRLIIAMTNDNPIQRPTITMVRNNDWMTQN